MCVSYACVVRSVVGEGLIRPEHGLDLEILCYNVVRTHFKRVFPPHQHPNSRVFAVHLQLDVAQPSLLPLSLLRVKPGVLK